jgi:hypothetical protein
LACILHFILARNGADGNFKVKNLKEVRMFKNKKKMVFVILGVLFVFYGIAFAAWKRSVTVSWQTNPDQNLYGYKVYIGTESRNYSDYVFVEKTMTNHSFYELNQGQTYYFCVTAVNSQGVESAYSEEVKKRIFRNRR